jgi:hypothetical protein
MNNETIQPIEDFAAYFGIDPDDVVSELGIFKRDDEGNYELISAVLAVQGHSLKHTIDVDAAAIGRYVPAGRLFDIEQIMTERDPLRCTECRKLACICDGA